jgi:hypothetical protein
MGVVFHQRAELTIVTEQVTIIRPYRSTHGWCRECGREVETVSLRDATAISGANVPMLVDSPVHQWHFADVQGKSVCLESLLKSGCRSPGYPGPEETQA